MVKVGLFVLLAIFVSENDQFSAFFEKLVPKQLFFSVSLTHSLLLIVCLIKQYHGKAEEEEEE